MKKTKKKKRKKHRERERAENDINEEILWGGGEEGEQRLWNEAGENYVVWEEKGCSVEYLYRF